MTDKMYEAPKWDARYSAEGYLFGTEPAGFLQDHCDLLQAGSQALVMADGEGRNSVYLAQQGLEVTTMDISSVGAAKSRALAEAKGVAVDVQVADVLDWEWVPEAFDLVVGVFIQFLSPERRALVFDGMIRTLRPGGRVLLHGYTPKQLEYGTGGPPELAPLYTEDLLADSFAGLTVEHLRSYEIEIAEGAGHLGMSALIDLVAQKPRR